MSSWDKVIKTYYAEPWRHYHTHTHIDKARAALKQMKNVDDIVYTAVDFHDVFWVPGYAENEERSADLADFWLQDAYTSTTLYIIRKLILATKHNGEEPEFLAEAQIRDADLASLADPWEDFMITQDLVRAEFASVPDDVYMTKRTELFAKMFKNRIFWTEEFRPLEATARENLIKSGIDF